MYVYKITDSKTDKVYIGVDTKPKEKLNRWHEHLKHCQRNPKTKFYRQLSKRPQDFTIEVVFESQSVGELFSKEIELIQQYDSYRNGYNSTVGGDCFGVVVKDDEHYDQLVEFFRQRMVEFNAVKWSNTTSGERREMLKELWTPEANAKRQQTIQRMWDDMSESDKDSRLSNLKKYMRDNHDVQVQKGLLGSMKALEINRRPVKIRDVVTNEIHEFGSIKEADSTLKTSVRYLEQLKKQGKTSKKWEFIDG